MFLSDPDLRIHITLNYGSRSTRPINYVSSRIQIRILPGPFEAIQDDVDPRIRILPGPFEAIEKIMLSNIFDKQVRVWIHKTVDYNEFRIQ
jgi:hypothetical protein